MLLFRIQQPYEEPPQLPDEFNIGFAYPNPFNSRFVIPVEMDQPGVISVKIWDMLGHIVLNTNHSLSAGYHDFVLFDENSNINYRQASISSMSHMVIIYISRGLFRWGLLEIKCIVGKIRGQYTYFSKVHQSFQES